MKHILIASREEESARW